jgi:branched-chain amino acid transport system ATP-binding protein
VLRIEGICAGYGRTEVLRDVSLEVGAGELVSILGANGAGKTTLFRVVSGVLTPVRGRVLFAGRDITGLPPHAVSALGVGQVPEGRQVFRSLSVLDNLRLAAWFGGARDRAALAGRLEAVFALFPVLRERQHQLAGTLSGGEQQMLAIGRALVGQPRLLLLDEPSLGLAPQLVDRIFAVIRRLHATGLTVVLIEQNAHAALRISDRAYVLEQGRVALTGPVAAILADDTVRSLYLGRRAQPVAAGSDRRAAQ